MKTVKLFILLMIIFNHQFLLSQDYKVRIGFLGNSITIGSGLSDPTNDCYPSQLGDLLETRYGDTCEIQNFAVSGRTMLKNGDYPLWNESDFDEARNYAPDICFICLGTNDSKPQNWDTYKDEFLDDYLSMIDSFKVRNQYTKFIVCYPPPAYSVVWGIRDSVIINGVIPTIDTVLEQREAMLVNFYDPLIDSSYLFPDYIHPNVAGAGVMAEIAFNRIVETDIIHQVGTPMPYVTTLKSGEEEIRQGDSVLIEWTTTNADEVFLNEQSVIQNGSLWVHPTETTTYTLVAANSKGKDSLSIVQNVYIPELSLLSVSPYRITINIGDSVDFSLCFYDQKNVAIENQSFSVTWSITEGEGNLLNETDTSATFIAESAGKAKVKAEAEGISYTATITVEEGSGLQNSEDVNVLVYPNPVFDKIFIEFNTGVSTSLTFVLYDINGKVFCQKNYESTSDKSQITINLKDLESGMYFYKIFIGGKCYSGELIRN